MQISSDQRLLTLRYESGPCWHRARASVTEDSAEVAIKVTQRAPSANVVCPAVLQLRHIVARLHAPLHGRRIIGQSLASAGHIPDRFVTRRERLMPLVPRVIGLAAPDAERALRAQRFQPSLQTSGGGIEVVDQAPHPGRTARSGLVRLRVR